MSSSTLRQNEIDLTLLDVGASHFNAYGVSDFESSTRFPPHEPQLFFVKVVAVPAQLLDPDQTVDVELAEQHEEAEFGDGAD
jgi:hypothetical protein